MKLYVASSWRNDRQQDVVTRLRAEGHEVYDFRHPPGGDHLGFSWSEIDPEWREWDVDSYLAALEHPIAQAGFQSDFGAMKEADGCVLVLPCGRSAHLEAGWMAGRGKAVWVLLEATEFRPWTQLSHADQTGSTELMYLMATAIEHDLELVVDLVNAYDGKRAAV